MEDQKNPTFIIAVVAIILFMAGVGGLEYIRGTQSGDQKIALLADVSSAASPTVGIPAAASTGTAVSNSSARVLATATASVVSSSPQKASSSLRIVIPSTTIITALPKVAPPLSSPSPSTPLPAIAPKAITPSTTTAIAGMGLPYSVGIFGNDFINGDGWSSWSGIASQQNGTLTVGAGVSSTVGMALFAASDNWKNYTFRAHVDWKKGQTFGLVAYYVDPKNFLVCDFDEPTPGTVHMSFRKYVNGTVTFPVTGDVNNYEQMGGDNIDAAIGVQGSQGFCSFNGHQITTYYLSNASSSLKGGGIGFSTWDPKVNNSKIVVHTVGVTSGLY